MNILIVGGTGLTGATAAKHLADEGHHITLMARSKPANPHLQNFDFMQGDYIQNSISTEQLKNFDALVFAAGADMRMLSPEQFEQQAEFFEHANSIAIPHFFAKAKAAGVKKAVYIGSYYPQVAPHTIETSAYVKSRHLADEGVRALADESFHVCSLNAPFILGHFPGLEIPHLKALVDYCAGKIPGLEPIAPAGGVVHISAASMADAIAGALAQGESGKAYLVGDAYMSWKDYFEQLCKLVGNAQTLSVSTDEHPMLPDVILYAGRNAEVNYQADNAPLNYRTNDIEKTMAEVAAAYA